MESSIIFTLAIGINKCINKEMTGIYNENKIEKSINLKSA